MTSIRIFGLVVLTAFALSFMACGGGGGGSGGSDTATTPASLAMSGVPTTIDSNTAIAPITVQLLNARNAPITTSGVLVTIELATNPAGGTLTGTRTVATVNGVATFSDLMIVGPGSGYRFRATAAGLEAETRQIEVMPEPVPTSLEIVTQPSDSLGGGIVTPNPVVRVLDNRGNPFAGVVSVTASIAVNPASATMSGTLTQATSTGGSVTFDDLSIDTPGVGFRLGFVSSGLTGTTSDAFNVSAQALQGVLAQIPSEIVQFEVPSEAFIVEVRDNSGSVDVTFGGNIELSIGNNPSGATLSGTTTRAATAGVATFDDLVFDNYGSGFSLNVKVTGLADNNTQAFDVRSFADAQSEPKSILDSDDLSHFLVRTQWAITPTSRNELWGAPSLADYIDDMLINSTDATLDQQLLDKHVGSQGDIDHPRREDLARWWQELMQETDDPFREVMSLFWHDHFAVSSEIFGGANLYMMRNHVNLLRAGCTDNFRQMLYDVATDWAMLRWLDGIVSRVNNINENFAREFWELFTLGVDNGYTQQDIEEAARCFTGFRERNDPISGLNYTEYQPTRHDIADKVVFGVTIAGRSGMDGLQEYWDVIDLTLTERAVECSEFVCRKLCEHFIYENPEPELVAAFAKTFRDNNWELKPVLKQMFQSKAFFSDRAKEGLVKSPVAYAMGLVRSTGMKLEQNVAYQSNPLRGALNQAGHVPTQPPNVAGWPQGTLWLSADNMVQRANIASYVITSRDHQENLGFDIRTLLPQPSGTTADQIVTALAELLRINPNSSERTEYINYLNSDYDNSENLISDPWDDGNDTQIDKKLRGLIYIMSQHPSYQLR